MRYTVVEYYGKQNGSRCGYCKGTKSSISHGMHAYSMSAQDYQDLIDRGWRRSGHYCYKQDNKTTCCPCYTIKCDALEFKLTKSQKKVLKRMNRFLRDGKRDKIEEGQGSYANAKNNDNEDVGDDAGGGDIMEVVQGPNVPLKDLNLDLISKSTEKKADDSEQNKECNKSQPQEIRATQNSNQQTSADSKKSFDGIKKAKQMRLERKMAKQAAKGLSIELTPKTARNQEKSLKDLINDTRPDDKHKLKLEVVHVKSEEFKKTLPQTYALYEKYQTIIHNDPPGGEDDYLTFLQRSPLQLSKPDYGPPSGYGSFHQQYWLDDKLIAVAVIDILPYCVSSVYFFYDPDYSFLSLGTYSSLREIELVQILANIVPSLKYYYMGFYIHSCPKMRYKGKLSPSYLLCPETYTWHLLTDEIREKLDVCKYQRLNNDPLAKDANEFKENDIDSVLLLMNAKTFVRYSQYKTFGGNENRDSIIEYSKLVGKTLAHRMLYLNF